MNFTVDTEFEYDGDLRFYTSAPSKEKAIEKAVEFFTEDGTVINMVVEEVEAIPGKCLVIA